MHSPSSLASSGSKPAATACWSSPLSTHCARESTTTRSASISAPASSSCLPAESAPIASTTTGRRSHAVRTMADLAGVTVRTMPAPRHAASADGATSAAHPAGPPSSSAAKARACSGRRDHRRTARQGVTAASIPSWYRACTPHPMTAMWCGSAGAKSDAASAPAAAVRSSVNRPPSSSTASGAKVRCEKTSTRPELLPPPPLATLATKTSPPSS
mmetsp:Transcript_3573/g.12337  ORF Transcript_3573/g.12337 Transcript_3573/m.12337 type:complete len:215 (-) Transcript_3573:120-764(-)